MKKIIASVMMVLALVGFVSAADWTGTKVGANTLIEDDVAGGIAIGDGGTASASIVSASGACQIGKGENSTANSIKFRDKYLVMVNGNSDFRQDYASGTSYYRWLLAPDASTASSTVARWDLFHLGSSDNSRSTNAQVIGMYIDVSRAAGYNAAANWNGGTFDTGLRVNAQNKATNNAAYSLRGAHVKAKNYSTGTVGQLEGLFVEAIGDGTEGNGTAIILKLGSDSSTVDIGIDMASAVVDVADIKLHHGTTILDAANGPTITATEVEFSGYVDAVSGYKVGNVAGFTGIITNRGTTTNITTFVGGVVTANTATP